jgi:uncharacterized membrane protein
MQKFLVYFMRGLLVTVPVAITAYVIYSLFSFIESVFSKFGTIVHPHVDPFLFIIVGVIIVVVMGMLGSSIILSPIFAVFDNALEHTPFIKTIYSSIKDLMEAFVGSKKKFNKPVLLKINKENNINQLGFITKEDLSQIDIKDGQVAVYVPMSYSLSGNLLIVPRENITPLNASSAEVMKFIVSGGVTDLS